MSLRKNLVRGSIFAFLLSNSTVMAFPGSVNYQQFNIPPTVTSLFESQHECCVGIQLPQGIAAKMTPIADSNLYSTMAFSAEDPILGVRLHLTDGDFREQIESIQYWYPEKPSSKESSPINVSINLADSIFSNKGYGFQQDSNDFEQVTFSAHGGKTLTSIKLIFQGSEEIFTKSSDTYYSSGGSFSVSWKSDTVAVMTISNLQSDCTLFVE